MMNEEVLLPTGMHDSALTLAGREDLARRAAPITMSDTSTDATDQYLVGATLSTASNLEI
jgi:hypothetical protein